MALRFSTALRNKILGAVPSLGGATIGAITTIAAVNGTPDSYTDSGNGFVTAGFAAGDTVIVTGFVASANNGIKTISSVAIGTIEIVETDLTDESAGPNVKISCVKGGSIKDIFKDGVLKIYSGSQPATADLAATGTLLVTVTLSSGAFTPGSPANGLEFGTASAAAIAKAVGAIWSGVIAVTGVAGWYRLYANATDAGAEDSGYIYPRIDGAVGVSGAEINLSSTSLTALATLTLDTYQLGIPATF